MAIHHAPGVDEARPIGGQRMTLDTIIDFFLIKPSPLEEVVDTPPQITVVETCESKIGNFFCEEEGYKSKVTIRPDTYVSLAHETFSLYQKVDEGQIADLAITFFGDDSWLETDQNGFARRNGSALVYKKTGDELPLLRCVGVNALHEQDDLASALLVLLGQSGNTMLILKEVSALARYQLEQDGKYEITISI